jgi:mannose-6-phosphate isomerase-like protein (cupin superfamily)
MIVRANEIQPTELIAPRGGTGTALRVPYDALIGLSGEVKAFAYMDLPPESSIGYHMHENDAEAYLLLDGFAEVNDNGKEDSLAPGDMLFTNKGESHSIANHTDKNLAFIALIIG